MPRNIKTLGRRRVSRPARQPFIEGLRTIEQGKARTFKAVEPVFLHTMADFDRLVSAGRTGQGDRQNGKGDFLNDVLALLLERCSGKRLHTRRGVPGLLFRTHNLDIAYPVSGMVQLTIETKATGGPKHPGSPKQTAQGRAGSADLEKRIKEAAFKDIDVKGEYARALGEGGGATSDLTLWLRRTPPHNWLFLSVRVRNQTDLEKTVDFAHIASRWFEACGLFAYGHENWDLTKPYEVKRVPTTVELDRVLAGVCVALRHL
ncbi:MAG TPA: hypothetical protein VMD79_08400 [Solirubrobacteraceae bacterium]|nr:hypothetical protein [Solirubrobacteraceae bacterium]